MSAPPGEDLRLAFADELLELTTAGLGVRLAESPQVTPALERFRSQFPDLRTAPGSVEELAELLSRGVAAGHRGVAVGPAEQVAGALYPWIRGGPPAGPGNFALVAFRSGLVGASSASLRPMLDDLSVIGGIPGMAIIAPADAPTTRAAVRCLAIATEPTYLRLTELSLPTLSDVPFQPGRARELRSGTDLTLLAVGTLVPDALAVAQELHHVGVEARVLDLASVKPIDAKAILRAARDTGALLTLEEHAVATGVGSLVAAITAENYPVPVRRLGIPDLAGEMSPTGTGRDRWGLSRERIVEEAWELLRMKGKVQ